MEGYWADSKPSIARGQCGKGADDHVSTAGTPLPSSRLRRRSRRTLWALGGAVMFALGPVKYINGLTEFY